MHVTLVYLGTVREFPDGPSVLKEKVRRFAERAKPVSGYYSGSAIFHAGDDSDGVEPVVALLDVPHLAELRTGLVQWLERDGLSISWLHDFTAHTTLSYSEGKAKRLPRVPHMAVTFGTMLLYFGGDIYPFPLKGDSYFPEQELLKNLPPIPTLRSPLVFALKNGYNNAHPGR
jgi:hypothetical protein